MSDKKIVVPEGMLNAALSSGVFEGNDDAEAAMEVALRWLGKKIEDIVPKEEPLGYMYRSPSMSEQDRQSGYNSAIRDIRKIFIKPPFDPSLGGKLSGYTFTRDEANEIIEYINRSVHPGMKR